MSMFCIVSFIFNLSDTQATIIIQSNCGECRKHCYHITIMPIAYGAYMYDGRRHAEQSWTHTPLTHTPLTPDPLYVCVCLCMCVCAPVPGVSGGGKKSVSDVHYMHVVRVNSSFLSASQFNFSPACITWRASTGLPAIQTDSVMCWSHSMLQWNTSVDLMWSACCPKVPCW